MSTRQIAGMQIVGRGILDTLALYVSTYLMVDVFCVVMGTVIIRKVSDDFGSELAVRYFRCMIGCYLIFCLTDLFWMPLNSGMLPPNTMLNGLLASLNMLSVSFLAYYWYSFAQVKLAPGNLSDPKIRLLSRLPVVLVAVFYLVTPFTGLMHTFTAEGALERTPLYLLASFLLFSYLIVVMAQGLWRMSTEDRTRRKEYTPFVTFAIIPAVGSIIDSMFANTPVVGLAVLTTILYTFSSLKDELIINDSLTGLNNRRRADQYLADKIASASYAHPVRVFVMDVNRFKAINDTYGHIEGDRALRIVANGLRHAAGRNKGFLARWGGDEFLLVIAGTTTTDSDAVIADVDQCLTRACEDAELPYKLTVSTGYTACTSRDDDAEALIKRADLVLYENKRVAHQRLSA